MNPGDIVTLTDHLPLFTGAGLRAGSRWVVASIHTQHETANLADRHGAIVACCVPTSRLKIDAQTLPAVAAVTDEDF